MKNLKLLNKKYLTIILLFLIFGYAAQSAEPVDIWNTEDNATTKKSGKSKESIEKIISQNTVYKMQSKKTDQLNIEEDQTLFTKEY